MQMHNSNMCQVLLVVSKDAAPRLCNVPFVVCRHMMLKILPCAVACRDAALRLCHVLLHAGMWHLGCAMYCLSYAGRQHSGCAMYCLLYAGMQHSGCAMCCLSYAGRQHSGCAMCCLLYAGMQYTGCCMCCFMQRCSTQTAGRFFYMNTTSYAKHTKTFC